MPKPCGLGFRGIFWLGAASQLKKAMCYQLYHEVAGLKWGKSGEAGQTKILFLVLREFANHVPFYYNGPEC